MKQTNFAGTVVLLLLILVSCGSKTSTNSTSEAAIYQKVSPEFNSDSAYAYVDKQVAFGPRVPNTAQHKACGDYLTTQLKTFGAEVTEQQTSVKAFDGTTLNIRNIIGSYSPDKKERILLFAHWDTRPFADQETNPNNHNKHILGANDGASGVGVLLEVARNLQAQLPNLGVDIIFFDAEDYGVPSFSDHSSDADWWCLGSQYWSKNPHIAGYYARFGILLDMVGASNATFYKEGYSVQKASEVTSKIWSTAYSLGYDKYFVNKQGGTITDDHVPVMKNRGIPCVDIIQLDTNTESGFGAYWHTLNDDMSNVSRETLKAVGQTVLEIIYKEK